LLAVSTGSLALYQITASRQSREWIVHSYRVIEAVHTMFSRVKDVESGTRGFMVNGNTSPLDDYDDGLAAFPAAADQLQALVRDNPAQAQRVRQLRQELELRISLARERVELGRAGKLYLPRSRKAEDIQAAAPIVHLGQNEIILVVEDEDLVRSAAVGALRDLGYVCLHASDAAEALKILESGAHIDLLFTDVIMPGDIKARDLAARAQVLIPGLPVLFTSGYTENAIVHHGRLDEGVSLISKPYHRDSPARRIRTMLEGARPTVLVVEDEPLVRMAAVDMIRDLGLAVIEAADAEQALGILESAARIDILFTDVGLPLMRGPELAARAKAMRPGIKVVFASGYGEGGRGAPAGAENLSKPYDQGDLARVLRVAS